MAGISFRAFHAWGMAAPIPGGWGGAVRLFLAKSSHEAREGEGAEKGKSFGVGEKPGGESPVGVARGRPVANGISPPKLSLISGNCWHSFKVTGVYSGAKPSGR